MGTESIADADLVTEGSIRIPYAEAEAESRSEVNVGSYEDALELVLVLSSESEPGIRRPSEVQPNSEQEGNRTASERGPCRFALINGP